MGEDPNAVGIEPDSDESGILPMRKPPLSRSQLAASADAAEASCFVRARVVAEHDEACACRLCTVATAMTLARVNLLALLAERQR